MRLLLLLLVALAACEVNRAASLLDGGAGADIHMGASDGPLPLDMTATDTVSASCAKFASFSAGKRVANFQTRKALIDPNLRRAWLISHKYNAYGDLYEMALPSGNLVKRGSGYWDIAWLGKSGDIMARSPDKGAPGVYTLDQVRPGTSKPSRLSEDTCAHKLSADGKRLLHLFLCKDNLGELHILDHGGLGLCTSLGSKVSRWGLAVNSDGSMIAFRQEISKAADCKQGSGTLYLYNDKTRKKLKVATDVSPYGVRFTPDGKRLLFRQVMDCKSGKDRLLGATMSLATPDKLTEKRSYGFFGHYEQDSGDWSLAVSPDSSRVLVADLAPASAKESKLISVRTDGKGEQVLAGDLFNFSAISAAMRVWAYSAGGGNVVYLSGAKYDAMEIRAVASGGGNKRRLSNHPVWPHFALSKQGEWVAHMERVSGGPYVIRLSDLASAAAPTDVASSAYPKHGLKWLPDSRGLLYVEDWTSGGGSLRYVSRAGAKVSLGSWQTHYWSSVYSHAMDDSACLVLYNNQGMGQPGTYLRTLPR